MPTNPHGLSRNIPDAIKSEVRRRSKNGCVICRSLVYDYEHIAPEFKDATEHNPENICLLCPGHHGEVTRGRLSKSQIASAYARVQAATELPPPNYQVELTGSLTLGMGDAVFEDIPDNMALVEYDDSPILSIRYVEDEVFGGRRPSITGSIYDIKGKELIRLNDNEVLLVSDAATMEFTGRSLTIGSQASGDSLRLVFSPPSGLTIDKLRMKYGDIICEMDDTFGVTTPVSSGGLVRFLVSKITARGAAAAISYQTDRSRWGGNSVEMRGGQGIILPRSGALLAKEAGTMFIKHLRLERP